MERLKTLQIHLQQVLVNFCKWKETLKVLKAIKN